MASKSKRARQGAAKAKIKSAWPVNLWALDAAFELELSAKDTL
jgi:hypothetical protein